MTTSGALVGVSLVMVFAACEPRAVHRTPVSASDGAIVDGPPRNADRTADRDPAGGEGGSIPIDGAPDAFAAERADVAVGPDAVRADAPVGRDAPLVADTRPVADLAPPSRDGPVCAQGTCKLVFLSSTAVPNGALGILATSDARCQALADGRGLGGTWRAWLSDANASPAMRFTRATVPYVLVDGTAVATSFDGLIGGTLMHAIDMFETGVTLLPGAQVEVWTGTTAAGTSAAATCGNWTNNSAGLPNGSVGVSDRTNAGWTQAYQQFCDRTQIHLYCFEQ